MHGSGSLNPWEGSRAEAFEAWLTRFLRQSEAGL